MSITHDLTGILGSDNVSDDEEKLTPYSSDQSFVKACRPDALVFVETVEQVQEVVRYANKTKTPLIPYSSGLNLHGGTIPKQGGIILNLSRMNRILSVDEENWFVVIEPGVTVQQLQDELRSRNLRAMLPFGIPPSRSALTSYVERDPALASASFEYGNDLLMDTEIVLPEGELFKTGLWSAGGKPGSPMGPVRSMLYRFWTAAQGTMGVLTKACFKVEHLPAMRRIFAFQFESCRDAIEPLIALQHREIGLECFLLNNFNMAALMCDEWQVPEKFPAAKIEAPACEFAKIEYPVWVLFICLSGGPELPEEKIAYEEEALLEITSRLKLESYNLDGKESFMLDELLQPWNILKKFCYKGSVQDVSFKSPIKRVPEFQKIIVDSAHNYEYPIEDIGGYILPIERGRAVHCEFDFHCNMNDPREQQRIKQLWLEVSEKLIDAGAFFDRPYGAWAEMMYTRTGEYSHKLKELKKELDPHNICNPGHLCF